MRIGNFDPADLSDVGACWLKICFEVSKWLGNAWITATACF